MNENYNTIDVPDEIIEETYIRNMQLTGNKMLDPEYIKSLDLTDDQVLRYLEGVGTFLVQFWYKNYKLNTNNF